LRYFDIMTLLIRETFSLLGPLSGQGPGIVVVDGASAGDAPVMV